jgi:uncharacterized protein (DUF433 family)
MSRRSLYDGVDPRELPAYSLREASRYVYVPPATLRSWVLGRTYPRQDGVGSFKPLIALPDPAVLRLSFKNLVEAHVLRSLRTKHAMPISAVREALDEAQARLNINDLLYNHQLLTEAGRLFVEYYGRAIELTKTDQMEMWFVLKAYLKRVERDSKHIPLRLFPFLRSQADDTDRLVAIDPYVSFGKPIVAGTGVSTIVLADRVQAGDAVEEIAEDYDITPDQVAAAVVFERKKAA